MKERLDEDDCKTQGWLLDGFPRTQAQAQALADSGITADCFVFLDVPDEVLVERVVGRRTDPVTGKIYHMTFSPPEDEEVLNRLEQRSDDTEEKVKVRLEQFHANVQAVKGSYTDIMVSVDGNRAPSDVSKDVIESITARKKDEAKGPSKTVPKSGKVNIIIAGAPASGKGTQCEVIKEKFGVVHLSTGDMLRAAVAAGTDVGKKAKDFMDSGKLVPDEVIIAIVSISRCTVLKV